MNETTIVEERPNQNGHQESKNESVAWKQVTLGGVSGILMGAGLLYAGQLAAKEFGKEEEPEDVLTPEEDVTSHTLGNGLHIAVVYDDLSFGKAFAQARAEVGPGGVFHWHGGIYNTYTAAEWNAMTIEQKNDFALQVKPEISVNDLSTPTDTNTHIVVEHHVYHHEDYKNAESTHQTTEGVQVTGQQTQENTDTDVHIVGYAEVDGHLAVGLDMDGDGQTDVAIIDVDDTGNITNPDVVIDHQGNVATVGEIAGVSDSNQYTSMENPNEAPDIPDYQDDLLMDV